MVERKNPQQTQFLESMASKEAIRSWLPILLVCLGILILGASLTLRFLQNREAKSTTESLREAKGEAVVPERAIKVDLSGAVEKPGVYQMPVDSRIGEALILAGGLTAKADRTYLSKYINLAQKLTDGQKVYIPFQGEEINKVNYNNNWVTSKTSTSGQININTASQQELESLPAIGPVTAQKVINGRPYQTIEELLTKKILGKAVFQKIKDRVTAN